MREVLGRQPACRARVKVNPERKDEPGNAPQRRGDGGRRGAQGERPPHLADRWRLPLLKIVPLPAAPIDGLGSGELGLVFNWARAAFEKMLLVVVVVSTVATLFKLMIFDERLLLADVPVVGSVWLRATLFWAEILYVCWLTFDCPWRAIADPRAELPPLKPRAIAIWGETNPTRTIKHTVFCSFFEIAMAHLRFLVLRFFVPVYSAKRGPDGNVTGPPQTF